MTITEINKVIINTVRKVLPYKAEEVKINLEIPPNLEMGHLGLACFDLAKVLKKAPAKLANQLAKKISAKGGSASGGKNKIIEKTKAIGPYLNFFLKKDIWFQIILNEILERENKFGELKIGQNKKILIEFSQPNPNKPQHLGHLRNNFLGESLANILKENSFKVIRLNLINDRGIHIAKSMLAYQNWGDNKTPQDEKIKGDHFVGKFYTLFSEKLRENPLLIDQAEKLLKKWEEGDPETISLWQKMNQWAINGFKETYEKFNIKFDHWDFESDIYQFGKKIVLKALKKGLCYRRDDGAIEIDLGKYDLDKKVLIRPDGTSIYIAQDIGLAVLRKKKFHPEKVVYIVGSEQNYHFKALFKILEIFGYSWAKNCLHLAYGLVHLPEGRLKSREGKVVEADEILLEMESLAKSEILKRNPSISPVKLSEKSHFIALSALKYFFLRFSPEQDVHFDPQASISFEGATGPYLLYTYARLKSIIRKAQSSKLKAQNPLFDWGVLGNDEEIKILQRLHIFSDSLEWAAIHYNPAILANHLLNLAQSTNEFYHLHPVLPAEENLKKARLILVEAVSQILKRGLNILGIEVLEEM